jgi:hypothetical protein
LTRIKAAPAGPSQGAGKGALAMTLTPFLILILAGYGVFIAVLGAVWIRNYIDDLQDARR